MWRRDVGVVPLLSVRCAALGAAAAAVAAAAAGAVLAARRRQTNDKLLLLSASQRRRHTSPARNTDALVFSLLFYVQSDD